MTQRLLRSTLLLLSAAVWLPSPARADWPADGLPVCTVYGHQSGPALGLDSNGGAIAGWIDARSPIASIDLYAMRVAADGTPNVNWSPQGTLATDFSPSRLELATLPDGFGGAFFVWADRKGGTASGPTDIRMVRLSANGQPAAGWGNNGLLVCGATGDQRLPRMASDGAGGVYVVWEDHRGASSDIYAARITGFGQSHASWPADGRALCAASGDQLRPEIVAEPGGDALVLWHDHRGATLDLYGIRVSPNGVIIGWAPNGLPICSALGDQDQLAVLLDGGAGVFAVWSDTRSGSNHDVYALRLSWSGQRPSGWLEDGNLVCGASGDQVGPAVASDSAGGILVSWQDGRVPSDAGDLYAQRLDAAAQALWAADGVPVVIAAATQSGAAIVPDGFGGAYVAWTDRRDSATTGLDLWAQRLRPDGTRSWPLEGFPICRAPGDATSPQLISDRIGGAYLAWVDGRDLAGNGTDLYLQRIAPEALEPTHADSLQTVHHHGQTFLAWSGPSNGIVWRIYRSSDSLTTEGALSAAELVATIEDSIGFDRRLSSVTGTIYGYVVDPSIPVRGLNRNLFVVTAESNGARNYAITAQAVGHPENRALVPDGNVTGTTIVEQTGIPEPVYQRTLVWTGVTTQIYTLWTWRHSIPGFRAMSNRAGQPFDCAVSAGGSGSDRPLMIRPHARQGYFLEAIQSTGLAGEWRLSPDDPLPANENSFWFGWHEDLDPEGTLPSPPTTGVIRDYTLRRILHTVGWARRAFPVDTQRVYVQGYSMASVAALLLALERPEWIAGILALTGKYDFAKTDDANPACAFNPGGLLRDVSDRMWGAIATGLTCEEGVPVYERLDFPASIDAKPERELPPLVLFDGRYDTVMGWTEKVELYEMLDHHRLGGQLYWDMRAHLGSSTAAWAPMHVTSELARLRCDLSFPAFSNGSANDDPGDGGITDGDSVGTINGHLEWDSTIVDLPTRWEVTLRLRPLPTSWGTRPAPDSALVDVTPRRLQQLAHPAGQRYDFSVLRLADSAIIGSGERFADSLGRVTVPEVRVMAGGVRLRLDAVGPLAADPGRSSTLGLGAIPNPLRRPLRLSVQWPAGPPGRIECFDVHGRRVDLARDRSPSEVVLDPARVRPGVYFLVASVLGQRLVRRLTIVH